MRPIKDPPRPRDVRARSGEDVWTRFTPLSVREGGWVVKLLWRVGDRLQKEAAARARGER
jgi:hypothetical protein